MWNATELGGGGGWGGGRVEREGRSINILYIFNSHSGWADVN